MRCGANVNKYVSLENRFIHVYSQKTYLFSEARKTQKSQKTDLFSEISESSKNTEISENMFILRNTTFYCISVLKNPSKTP